LGHTAYDTDIGYGGSMLAQAVTLSSPATLQSFNFNLYFAPTPGSNAKVGIYSSSSNYPQTLVASSPSMAPVNGWNKVDVGPVSLSAGTYWMTLDVDANTFYLSMDSTVPMDSLLVSGDLPSTFPSSATPLHYSQFAEYLEFCP